MTENEISRELSSNEFRERMIKVIREFAGTRYTYLEERTGISARKWKNVCNRVQQPSIEMLIEITKVRPYFLYWLVTGTVHQVYQASLDDEDWSSKLRDALTLGIKRIDD